MPSHQTMKPSVMNMADIMDMASIQMPRTTSMNRAINEASSFIRAYLKHTDKSYNKHSPRGAEIPRYIPIYLRHRDDEQEDARDQGEVAEASGGPLDVEHAVLLPPFARREEETVSAAGVLKVYSFTGTKTAHFFHTRIGRG